MQARYVILRVLLEADAAAGGGLLAIDAVEAAEDGGKPDLLCRLNRGAIAVQLWPSALLFRYSCGPAPCFFGI